MRTIIALVFVALLAGAFAHKSKAPIQESKLVASLKGLFQLAAKDELEDVADILAEVRSEIEATLDRVRSNYAAEESDAEEVFATYEDNLSAIGANIAELQVAIASADDTAESLQETIDSAVEAISEAQAQQDAEEARRTDYHNAFRSQVDQLNTAVEAAEDALRLLQEIDTEDLSGSFLEINNKKIKTNFEAIHKTLHGLKLSNSVVPMTRMLVEIAAAGINHDLISQLEDLLNQLIEIIEGEINDAVAADNNDDDFSRSTLGNLQSTIDSQSSSAETNQASLDELKADLEADQDALENDVDSYQTGIQQYGEAKSAWAGKSHDYDALIKRLGRDIDALEAAENFVDRD